jgi:hypothetical protein
MKLYVIQNSGVEHNELLGFYTDKKLAERDMDFIGENDVFNVSGGSFQERWVKIGDCWYEQHRSRRGRKKFPPWESVRKTKKSGWIHGTMYVATYEIRDYSLSEMMAAVRAWQRDDNPIRCPENTNHKMVAKYLSYPAKGIGLKCTDRNCNHHVDANNPILGIIHASFLRDRAQATEARRLRSVRKAQSNPSSHARSTRSAKSRTR